MALNWCKCKKSHKPVQAVWLLACINTAPRNASIPIISFDSSIFDNLFLCSLTDCDGREVA
jgi:hypothetical protein